MHKLKRLVQSPNSFFMDVKCHGCLAMYAQPPTMHACMHACRRHLVAHTLPCAPARTRAPARHSTTVFSHSQTVVVCNNCTTVLCRPTGGKATLTSGCSFRKKAD